MDYRTVRFELVRKTPGAKYIAGGAIYIAAYLRTCSIFDPFKVDQHIIQSNNQSVMELMDHHQNSPELIRWNKTMEFGASHMYLSAERKLVTSNFDLI